MKRNINEKVFLVGKISRIKFSQLRNSVLLNFDQEGGVTVEFRNGKINRADHVKKLRLSVGDEVLLIGKKISDTYVYGYAISKHGMVSDGRYSLMTGHVTHIVNFQGYGAMIKLELPDGTVSAIRLMTPMTDVPVMGAYASFLCYRNKKQETCSACKEWNIEKCKLCRKPKEKNILLALQAETITRKA